MKNVTLIVLLLASFFTAVAQNKLKLTVSVFDDHSDDKIMLALSIPQGDAFSLVEFQYSTDSVQFETIHSFALLAADTSAKQLRFLHPITHMGVVYYRVKTNDAAVSASVNVDLDKLFSSVTVVPNPARSSTLLCFNNRWGYSCSMRMINTSGYEVLVLQNITCNKIRINTADLKPGIYHFLISSDNGQLAFDGKLLVAEQ